MELEWILLLDLHLLVATTEVDRLEIGPEKEI